MKWFILEISKKEDFVKDLIRKVEKAGFKGIVLTCDLQALGSRFETQRANFVRPSHLSAPNLESFGSLRGLKYFDAMKVWGKRPKAWEDIRWLKSLTKLPIILKGILTGEDAKLAVEYGADAILVSNHGGRQLDGVPATVSYYSLSICFDLQGGGV
jgi:(S)-2-hydroxy-acid oxidase